MKAFFTRVFWFILDRFEKGEGPYSYKASSRKILLIVGMLFISLSLGSLYFSLQKDDFAGVLPVIVFFGVGFVCLIIGLLGTDRAVATLWGSATNPGGKK